MTYAEAVKLNVNNKVVLKGGDGTAHTVIEIYEHDKVHKDVYVRLDNDKLYHHASLIKVSE